MLRPSAVVRRSPLAAGALLLGACATVDATADYERTAAAIRSATGVANVYQPGGEQHVPQLVQALCDGGLELREAVEIAMLNHPALQAAFRGIGMARANAVQASLLANPSLSLALRFYGSGAPVAVDAGLFASFSDLWQRPSRQRAAESALQRDILLLAHDAVQLAAAVAAAYLDSVTADRLQQIAEANRETAQRLLDLAEARLAAQAATAIDANLARLDLAATAVAWRDAQLAAVEARRTLASRLGFDALPVGTTLSTALPEAAAALPPADALQRLALAHRLDVRAAAQEVARAAEELHRQRGLFARSLDVGVVAEQDPDWSVGPGLQLELPLFDQNQAQAAKARDQLAQGEQRLAAVRLEAGHEVGSALARAQASWDAAGIYADEILLRATSTLDLATESYRAGTATIVPVLEAQRSLLEARRAYVLRLRAAAGAMSDLERATGTPRERLFEPVGDEPK